MSVCAFAKPDWPLDTGCQSEAGIVMDLDSGAVHFAQNIHVQEYPASITKRFDCFGSSGKYLYG